QAVQPRRSRGARTGRPTPHGRRPARRRPPFCGHDARRGATRGAPRRDARRPDRDRVRAAPLLPPQPAPRALERTDPAERLALRLRRQLERRRDVRELPAQEARRTRAAADPDDPAGGLHARSGGVVVSRFSLRTRLLVGVIALAAGCLVAADVATYSAPRPY